VVTVADQQKKTTFFCDGFLNDDFKILRKKKIQNFFYRFFKQYIEVQLYLKNVGISISKCLKSAAKNRRTNQKASTILSAPTVYLSSGVSSKNAILY
jgi:hypothetical protein